MRTVIELRGTRTTIDDGESSGSDPIVRAILTHMYQDTLRDYSPDRDYQVASAFIQRHGGTIVEYDGPGTEDDSPDIVY